MSAELRRAKARYIEARLLAYQQAVTLREHIGLRYRVGEWSLSVEQRYQAQWVGHERRGGGFDWSTIFRRFREPNRLDIVLSVEDRLCGLALATVSTQYVHVRFIEGDPRPDCPLRGRRALIILETAAAYAQRLGRRELRLQPMNSSLEDLYRDTYGFTAHTPRNEAPYFRKEV